MDIIREIKSKGIVVIPKDVRQIVNLKERDKISFSVKGDEIIIRKQQDPKEWIKNFFNFPKKRKKSMGPEEIDKIYGESYDLP